jgi:dUTP pyrophosphatase
MDKFDLLSDELSQYLREMKNNIDETSKIEIEGVEIDDLDLAMMDQAVDSYQHKLSLKYTKLSEEAIDPKYNYNSDSGFDLHSVEKVTIPGLSRSLVSTGLKFDIPEGYEIQIRSKSGLAYNHGLMVLNSPGTVDQGYNGEIKVIIFNTTRQSVDITKGQKIGQAVLCPVVSGNWVNLQQTDNINNKERGSNGFGSTGI